MATPESAARSPWVWHPELPIGTAPVFAWPPKPVEAAKYLLGRGLLLSPVVIYFLLSACIWLWLTPAPERWATLEAGWVAQVFAVNLGLVVLVAGSLHLFFHTFRGQRDRRRFDPRNLERDNPRFFANDQVRDNIFWTCVSGVTTCTALQVPVMWAYANGLAPRLDFEAHPVWFILWLVAIPFWSSFHFYLIHRLLHWPPLYRTAHAVHHRNINIGPWSGLSMHPIEHLLYFSSILIHLVVASHPLHILFHTHHKFLGAITSHTGFSDLLVKQWPLLGLGDFFHQLHHRYFDCNYGGADVPCDQWFDSFHDGTPEATARIREFQRERQRERRGTAASSS